MRTGVYQHFKGDLYFLDTVGKHSETQEEFVVCYDDKGETRIWPKAIFSEEVNRDGYTGPRFKLVREVFVGRMMPSELLSK